jgi:hypothetical protein
MTSVTHVPGLFCYPCPRLHPGSLHIAASGMLFACVKHGVLPGERANCVAR